MNSLTDATGTETSSSSPNSAEPQAGLVGLGSLVPPQRDSVVRANRDYIRMGS